MPAKGKYKLSEKAVRRAAEVYFSRRELTLLDVAKKLGVSSTCLHQAFQRYDVPRKPWCRVPHKVHLRDLEYARREGWTKAKLARRLGVKMSSIRRAQLRFGFDWPERDRPEHTIKKYRKAA